MNSKNPAVRTLALVLFWLVVAVVLFYVLFPFYWAIKTSLTGPAQLSSQALQWFPTRPTGQNFTDVFAGQPFGRNLFNVHEPILIQTGFPDGGANNVGAIYGLQSFRQVGLSLDAKF